MKGQVDDAHQKLGKHQSLDLSSYLTSSQGSLKHHASVADRVEYLEKLMGDSADRHSSELGQAQSERNSVNASSHGLVR